MNDSSTSLSKLSSTSSGLSPEIKALLQGRREMFSQAQVPSVLPDLHRRIRAAAMERTSLRQTLRTRLSEWADILLDLNPAARLGYAGAFAAVALALFVGLQQSWKSGDSEGAPLLTLNQTAETTDTASNVAQAADKVSYSLNNIDSASTLPVSLDQKIDQVMADADDLSHDAASAHYVLTRTPASYDSVVAF